MTTTTMRVLLVIVVDRRSNVRPSMKKRDPLRLHTLPVAEEWFVDQTKQTYKEREKQSINNHRKQEQQTRTTTTKTYFVRIANMPRNVNCLSCSSSLGMRCSSTAASRRENIARTMAANDGGARKIIAASPVAYVMFSKHNKTIASNNDIVIYPTIYDDHVHCRAQALQHPKL
jgi:hypothetical protein